MGVLIPMTRPTASNQVARPPFAGEAEILFFTGVRYYRMTEDLPTQVKAPRRRRAKVVDAHIRLDRHA